MYTLADSDFYLTPTALILSAPQHSLMQNDILSSIADELDFDLSFNFQLENESFLHLSNDITANLDSDSSSANISTTTTTISDLIDSTPSISDLLQTDFSQFDTSEFEAFASAQLNSTFDSDLNLMSADNPTVFQLEEYSSSCASPDSSSMTSFASESAVTVSTTSHAKCAKNKEAVLSGRVDKKDSNKAAATRYRTKKLKEREELFVECEMYAKKNATLKGKIDDLQTEISFIKSLLVEVLIRKTKVWDFFCCC